MARAKKDDKQPTYEDLAKLLAKGEPLPAGYAYNARQDPPIFRVDGESVPGPEAAGPDENQSTE